MTVLRAALLFDHPTTRLFASRILESFFCPPRSSLPPPRPPALRALPPQLGSFLLPSSLASPLAARAHPSRTFLLRSPPGPFATPESHPLVPRQPPSIGVLCKQTHESERRIEGFPSSSPSPRPIVYVFFFYFYFYFHFFVFAFVVSSQALADSRKVKRVATMGKAACPLSTGMELLDYARLGCCAACEIRRNE